MEPEGSQVWFIYLHSEGYSLNIYSNESLTAFMLSASAGLRKAVEWGWGQGATLRPQ